MASLLERHRDKIRGVISCCDRVLIRGTLPGFCYAEGMTSYLNACKIRIFDYPLWAEPLRDEIKTNAERFASEAGVQIEFIRKIKNFRKEDRVKEIIRGRGDHPGLVHIFSAMEICQTYKPWHDKGTGKTSLRADNSKCLHYYFYFIDEQLGLCHVRVPTWAPFRLQVYFNGHNWLASKLKESGISYDLRDNAFFDLGDFEGAQVLADDIDIRSLHKKLDEFAERYCPVIRSLDVNCHWSLAQTEYATDIVFKRRDHLQLIYDNLVRTAIHAVRPENVATFLGHKLHGNYDGEIGNRFDTRIEGTRIRHSMGAASIKMYDKFGSILRIETTTNDVSFFKHYREVEQRDGTKVRKWAHMKRDIYSLGPLKEVCSASNRRYLDFISAIDDPSDGISLLRKISEGAEADDHRYKGFNFFCEEDAAIFEALVRGEFNISGFRNKSLRGVLKYSASRITRLLNRLRTHGMIRRIGRTYKYYLTKLGRSVIVAALKFRNIVAIPQFCAATV